MKKLNLNECIWFGILLGFGSYIYYLLNTGKISHYIHPRMSIYLMMAMIIFFLLAIVQMGQLFNTSRSTDIKWGNFMFIIPLLLVTAIDPTEIGIKALSNKGLVIDNHYDREVIDGHEHNTLEARNFEKVVEGLENPNALVEEAEVLLKGFVYKEEKRKPNEFILSRLMMSCCVADSWIQGIRCEWGDSDDLVENQWVEVKAKVKYIPYYHQETKEIAYQPLLKVYSIKEIDKPSNPYIYY